MRVAVFSDVHSNLHALEAVLAAVDADPPDELWCLGDVVGYGAKPNECCAIVAERARVCLGGNHDLAVRGTIDLDEFSGDAGAAARWTRGVLTGEALAYLNTLEPRGEAAGVALFHGSARDPVWEYVLSDEAAVTTLLLTEEPVVLVGHSHVALQVVLRELLVEGGLAPDGTELELTGARWLLNPGSVGQPRDGDARAAYLSLDLAAERATYHRVEYDIERTQAEIREAGLPELLALRLSFGQ
ncbi:MAG: metallophosphoesterase family protein [Actinobacteria bacterium]|nr:MAG: metallophosphoesterase family protein [Actinomycetota bacterium]